MFSEAIKNIHAGQTVYIIGKGPSLNFLTKDMIADGPVITLNHAISKVESLNLPNLIYSLQKDKYEVPVKPTTTLILHKHESVALLENDKPEYYEFDATEFKLPIDTFSAIIAIEMAKIMGCVKFVFISFDSVNGDVETFDPKLPSYPTAYIRQAERMRAYVTGLDCDWITPKESTIVLITPTGGRAKQIALCSKWMKRQTYKGKVLWIIVDDCFPLTANIIRPIFRDNWTIIHYYPVPTWKPGQNTQSRNLQAGIDQIPKGENVSGIFIIEDDDYYKPKYLQVMTTMLRDCDLCGEKQTLYFNTKLNAARRCRNNQHSSLFQTAFKPRILPYFKNILTQNQKFIDIELFKIKANIHLFSGLDLAIGIKGLPGRSGIGQGHDAGMYRRSGNQMNVRKMKLEELIGSDSEEYDF